jgi:hypothetical protein
MIFAIPKSSTLAISSSSSGERTRKMFSGFQVAVDDAGVVRTLEGAAHLAEDPRGLCSERRPERSMRRSRGSPRSSSITM